MRTVLIPTAGNNNIEGTLVSPRSGPGLRPAALFLHGWGSTRDKHLLIAKLLANLDCLSLTIDMRGHGKTKDLMKAVSARDNLQDVVAAYDFLASRRDVDANRIAAMGFSYGGFLAVLLSAQRAVRWLALRSPALYRDQDLEIPKCQIKRKGLLAFRQSEVGPEDNLALRAAAAFQGDVLIVESENDRLVPRRQVNNYLHAFSRAKSLNHVVIPKADHSLSRPQWRQAAVNALVQWFKNAAPSVVLGAPGETHGAHPQGS